MSTLHLHGSDCCYLTWKRSTTDYMEVFHDWMISSAMHTNLATYEDTANQQRPKNKAAITEDEMKFGLKEQHYAQSTLKKSVSETPQHTSSETTKPTNKGMEMFFYLCLNVS